MATVPPIICNVPKSDDTDPTASGNNGQTTLPGFFNIPKGSRASSSPQATPPPPFQTRLHTGQKFERHLLGWLRTQYPTAFLLPARSDQFNGAPYLFGHDCGVIQPDIMMLEPQRVTWWECKFRYSVYPKDAPNTMRPEVCISLRHWKHYQRLWAELCYPFYIVFAIAQQNKVICAQVAELDNAITKIVRDSSCDSDNAVFFDCGRLAYLLSFKEFTQL